MNGERIRQWRTPKTQADCARLFGVSVRSWKRYESLDGPPRWLRVIVALYPTIGRFLKDSKGQRNTRGAR